MKTITLIIAVILASGCRQDCQTVSTAEVERIAHQSAVEAFSRLQSEKMPDVPDAPRPGDPCGPCGGTGQVGDGVTVRKCLDCDGTGKVQAACSQETIRRLGDLETGFSQISDRVSQMLAAKPAVVDRPPPEDAAQIPDDEGCHPVLPGSATPDDAPQEPPAADDTEATNPDKESLQSEQQAARRPMRRVVLLSRTGCPPCAEWWANERPKYERQGWPCEKVITTDGTTPRFIIHDPDFDEPLTFDGYMTIARFNEVRSR